MTQPLALILYEKLLPGSQLVNRLQDLNYRVQTLNEATTLTTCAEQTKPMVVLADLQSTRTDICAAIAALKKNPATQHLPVIAFGGQNAPETQAAAARAAGVTLLVSDVAILNHLSECLEQALRVD
jgi:CheY-like chemotaxis protein